jgi:hypothetical protein
MFLTGRDLIDALDSGGVDVTTTLAGTAAELRAEMGTSSSRAQRASTVRDDIDIDISISALAPFSAVGSGPPVTVDVDPGGTRDIGE